MAAVGWFMSDSRFPLVRYKSHCYIYRGFNIYVLPRNVTRKITQYHVMLSDGADSFNSFGKVDALAQATGFIDSLFDKK